MKKNNNIREIILFIIVIIIAIITSIFQYRKLSLPNLSTGDTIKEIIADKSDKYDMNATYKVYDLNEYGFEVNINGSTGYAPMDTNLKEADNISSTTIGTLKPGWSFKIIKEQGDWWYIYSPVLDQNGWVEKKYCMINLPDVIPSIVYDNTNSYSSRFKTSGEVIKDITGKQLYDTKVYNERLEKKTYDMPAMYEFARKIALVQHNALLENNSLKIYETYRPREVQLKVSNAVSKMANEDPEIYNNLISGYWQDLSWFINLGLSNHQIGIAMDTSLVKITKWEKEAIGYNMFINVLEFEEYKMPTEIHELSLKAITFQYPVMSESTTAWKNAPLAVTMTDGALLLQKYCTSAGLTPLSSEWWHFNDLDAKKNLNYHYSMGEYCLANSISKKPE